MFVLLYQCVNHLIDVLKWCLKCFSESIKWLIKYLSDLKWLNNNVVVSGNLLNLRFSQTIDESIYTSNHLISDHLIN